MLKKGMNPWVFDYDGKNEIQRFPSNFENKEAQCLLAETPRSVHFSIEDIECEEWCSADCPSKFDRFYYKNGPLVEITEENRIGKGGFGWVYKQLFHGKPMAMKCSLLGELDPNLVVDEGVENLENDISELRIQSAIAGPGVLNPVAFIRQQDQEQDEDEEWIALNYDIYIYPLYDCNLYELHENYYGQFSDEILLDILHQCFTRKSSNLEKYGFQNSL